MTKEEFRMLRDGGDYINKDTGEKEHSMGHFFDEVVFNDSVKEFMALRRRLANYFEPTNEEDIFNYIPHNVRIRSSHLRRRYADGRLT